MGLIAPLGSGLGASLGGSLAGTGAGGAAGPPVWVSGAGHTATTYTDGADGAATWALAGGPSYNATVVASGTSNTLKVTGFSVVSPVPVGATITGVQVVFGITCGTTGSVGSLKLLSAAGVIGTDKGSPTPTINDWTTFTEGDSADLWGAALTPAIINDPGFGFALKVHNGSASSALAKFAISASFPGVVPVASMKVWYT
jgi:hypothetical protein